mmetsp:Transcript_38959/g.69728  ORF Transcript_38959/g.69728 Transcript_38959/m.69728 type:complete len:820 (-) Transcript_38959:2117-4576(-)
MGGCCSNEEVAKSDKYATGQSSKDEEERTDANNALPLLAFTAIEQFGQMPKARRGHTLVSFAEFLILYGGFSTNSQVFSDCRIFDLRTGEWTTLNIQGIPPAARCTHTTVIHEREMYVYGIHSGDCAELFSLNLDTESWSCVAAWGDLPAARGGHSAIVAGDTMYVFAGETVTAVTNDLYTFDFGSKRWKIHTAANLDFVVMPRRDHSAVVHDAKMYVYGGFNDVNERMDILCLDTKTDEWSSIEDNGPQPPWRGAHSASVWKDTMLVYGGMYENVHRNDLWILDFTTYRWTEVQYARCRADLPLLTPEILTCPTNPENLPEDEHSDGQPVFMADHQYGTVGLLARRKICTRVCPDPQPFVPETVSQGQPVVPCGSCYHTSEVWNDCLYIWGGGDENVNFSECYCLYLEPLSEWFPAQSEGHTPKILVTESVPDISRKGLLKKRSHPPSANPQRVTFASSVTSETGMQHQRPSRVEAVPGPEGGERSDRGPTPTLDSDDETDTAPVSSSRISPGMKDPMSPEDRPDQGLLGVSLGTSMGCSLKSEGLLRMMQEERELLAEEDDDDLVSDIPGLALPSSDASPAPRRRLSQSEGTPDRRSSVTGHSPVHSRSSRRMSVTSPQRTSSPQRGRRTSVQSHTSNCPSIVESSLETRDMRNVMINMAMRPSKRRNSISACDETTDPTEISGTAWSERNLGDSMEHGPLDLVSMQRLGSSQDMSELTDEPKKRPSRRKHRDKGKSASGASGAPSNLKGRMDPKPRQSPPPAPEGKSKRERLDAWAKKQEASLAAAQSSSIAEDEEVEDTLKARVEALKLRKEGAR